MYFIFIFTASVVSIVPSSYSCFEGPAAVIAADASPPAAEVLTVVHDAEHQHFTALHWAVFLSRPAWVDVLLQMGGAGAGAAVQVRDLRGRTPVDLARAVGPGSAAAKLLETEWRLRRARG